jgi:hypothetical protein
VIGCSRISPAGKKRPEAFSLRLYGDALVLVRYWIVLYVRPVALRHFGRWTFGKYWHPGPQAGRTIWGAVPLPEVTTPRPAASRRIHGPPFLAVSINSPKKAGGFFTPARSPIGCLSVMGRIVSVSGPVAQQDFGDG